MEDLARMERSVRVIQKAFIKRQSIKKRKRFLKRQQSYRDEVEKGYGDEYNNSIDDCEEGQCSSSESYYDFDSSVDDCYSRSGNSDEHHYKGAFRRQSMLRRINEQGDDYDEEIDVEWRKPSWKFAKKFEAQNRPHRSGKKMAKYDWSRVTLGRHCYAGGCGEQLDLWNEGRTSEFSQFGSGITNYFKVSVYHVYFTCRRSAYSIANSYLNFLITVLEVVFVGNVYTINSSPTSAIHQYIGYK